MRLVHVVSLGGLFAGAGSILAWVWTATDFTMRLRETLLSVLPSETSSAILAVESTLLRMQKELRFPALRG